MQPSPPVFPDRRSLELWNRLASVERDLSTRKRQAAMASLSGYVAEVARTQQRLHPATMAKLLGIVARETPDAVAETVSALSENMGLRDSLPAIVAAGLLVDAGEPVAAKSMLDRLESYSDPAAYRHAMARIAMASGAVEEAVAHLKESREADDFFMPAYDLLADLEPEGDWESLRGVARVIVGLPPRPVDSGPALSPAVELYEIWWESLGGGVSKARAHLEHTGWYLEGHPEYVMSAARMAAANGEYTAAISHFERILEKGESLRARVGLARACLDAGLPGKAAEACAEARPSDARDRRLVETRLRAYAAGGRMGEFRRLMGDYLEEEYADLDSYAMCVDLLFAAGMDPDARMLIDRLGDRCPDCAGKYVMMSVGDLKANRLASALSNASKAVRMDPDDLAAKRQRAYVHLRMGRYRKALADVNASLAGNRDDVGLLTLKMEILQKSGSTTQALDAANAILALDPRNANVMRDAAQMLDDLGRPDEAYRMYKDALDLREDRALFMRVMDQLMRGGRYEGVVELVRDHDDTYGQYPDVWAIRGNAEYAMGEYADAADSYSKASALAPSDPTIWHSQGMAEEAGGYMDRAETCYDRAVLLDLDNPLYWISKASAQEKRGNLSGAVDSLNRVISDSPDNLYALVRKACIMAKAGECGDASHFLDLALKVSPKDPGILAMKRDISMRLGDHGGAVAAARAILSLDRDDLESYIAMSRAQTAMGEHRAALDTIDRGIRRNASEPSLVLAKADALRDSGDGVSEAAALESYLMLDGDDRAVKLRLAELYTGLGSRDSAEALYAELEAEDPKDREVAARKAIAVSVAAEGDTTGVLGKALEKDPDNVPLLIGMSKSLASAGRFADAVGNAERAIALEPGNVRGYLAKADALRAMGDSRGAADALQAAISGRSSADPAVWRMLGSIQEESGDAGVATISYDTAIKLGDESPGAYIDRGRAQEATGAMDRALNSYGMAAAKDPRNPDALQALGALYVRMGRESQGVKYLEEALRNDPFHVPSILERSKVYERNGDAAGVERMRLRFIEADPDARQSVEFAGILSGDVGPSARGVVGLAANLLRVSHEKGIPPVDGDALEAAHVPEEMREQVLGYIADIRERKDISPEDPDFARMEELSRNVVTRERLENLEVDSLITVQAAFSASGAATVEEAKNLVAYIHRAMTQEIVPERFSDGVGGAVDDLLHKSGDISLFGIITSYGLGVYSARVVKMLATSASVEMHI
ncbi:MAG: tetratricopeptide repeat protein [Thermoplasmatales archaeon]|nr:tetratricopeptide repeat protein [Thermoplasmatales archaeon]